MKKGLIVIGLFIAVFSFILTNPKLRTQTLSTLVTVTAHGLSLYTTPIDGVTYETRVMTGLLRLVTSPHVNRTKDDIRADMDTMMYLAYPRDDVAITKFVVGENGIPVFKATPLNKTSDVVLLYFHGGYHIGGNWKGFAPLVTELAHRLGGVVYFPEFRLAPEYPLPAATLDCVEVYKYVINSGHVHNNNIFFAGDSAGGAEVALTLVKLKQLGLDLPRGGWMISPYTDLTQSSKTYDTNAKYDILIYRDVDYVTPFAPQCMALGLPTDCHKSIDMERFKDPQFSPLWADVSALPPLLIHVSLHECLYDDSRLFAEKLRESDVDVTLKEYPYQQHDFHLFFHLTPEASSAVDHGVSWILKTKHQNRL